MADKQPIDSGLIARLSGAWKALTGKNDAWMGPLETIHPVVPENQQGSVVGRQLDYQVGYNIQTKPRGNETVTFPQMRALADSCDVLRLVIETRKDQLGKMKWTIKPSDDDQAIDDRCKEVKQFLKFPDGENSWEQWLRILLEDMLVIDAATVYPWMTQGGRPYRFEPVDGSTIKRVIDPRGRTPAAPDPAYQQILKGVPAVDYTADELIYLPRNKRSHKIYGYSPVEQVIMTVNIAIRRALHQLQYYTEGSTPDLLFQVPETWNMTQIKEFNDWWQDCLAGNTAARRKAQFVPHGVTPVNTKDGILKDEYDEWLARIICYAFSVSAQPFVKQQNRSTAETAQAMALEEGLMPVMQWVKGLLDLIIWKYFGYQDLEFKWEDQAEIDPNIQNQIDDRDLKNGSATLNEVRAKRGDPPVEGGDIPMVMTSTGYVPINAYFLNPPAVPVTETPPPTNDDNEPPPDKGDKPVDDKAEKIAKADKTKKLIQPIDHERSEIVKIRSDLADGLKGVFKAQAQKVADAVISNKMAKRDSSGDEFDLDGDWHEYEDLFSTQLVKTTKDGVMAAYAQIDIDDSDAFDLANDNAISWAEKRAAELVGKRINDDGEIVDNPDSTYSINDATREMIRGDVTAALESGMSNQELASQLADSYAFSDQRAEMIARTETGNADIAGNMELYRSSGVVEKKEWITGAGCCDECDELNGEQVGLNEDFSVGVDSPLLHPQCRCAVLPVINEDNDA